jgi:hypothetical protein
MQATKSMNELVAWRWAPCFGLIGGTLLIILFLILVVPTRLGAAPSGAAEQPAPSIPAAVPTHRPGSPTFTSTLGAATRTEFVPTSPVSEPPASPPQTYRAPAAPAPMYVPPARPVMPEPEEHPYTPPPAPPPPIVPPAVNQAIVPMPQQAAPAPQAPPEQDIQAPPSPNPGPPQESGNGAAPPPAEQAPVSPQPAPGSPPPAPEG